MINLNGHRYLMMILKIKFLIIYKGTNWYDQSQVNSCDDEPNTNHFLGGHCKLGMDKITKEIKNLTDHKYVKNL